MTLTFKEVAEIMKIIDASSCEEVVLELEGVRLVVRRGEAASRQQSTIVQPPSPAAPMAASEPAASVSQAKPVRAPAAKSELPTGGMEIRAPMVGSFYRRPSPDKPSFVEVGAKVQPGEPLCLIEVMKLYTTIEATTAGTVSHIAVEDAQLVEFDQLLFVITPD